MNNTAILKDGQHLLREVCSFKQEFFYRTHTLEMLISKNWAIVHFPS